MTVPIELERRSAQFDQFILQLGRVELHKNGRMRWYVGFWNRTDQDINLGIDYRGTYLADEFGNRYGIIGVNTDLPPDGTYREQVKATVKIEHWFEFPSPKNGAKIFTIGIVPWQYNSDVTFDLATVDLNYDPALIPVPTATSVPPEITLLPINEQRSSGNLEKFIIGVDTIELRDNGRLRWNFSFWNQTDRDLRLGLDYGATYLADEFGNRYAVTDVDTQVAPNSTHAEVIQAGVRVDHWFEFDNPRNGAQEFIVGLVPWQYNSEVTFTLFKIRPGYEATRFSPPEPTVIPEDITVLPINEQRVSLNYQQFSMNLTSVDLMRDGSMRWNISFWNQTDRDLQLAFNYSATYLVDEFGNRYAVTDVDTKVDAGGNFHEWVQPGVRVDHWLEFPPPKGGATTFTLGIVPWQYRSDVTFALLQVTPGHDITRFPTPVPTSIPADITVFPVNDTRVSANIERFTLTVTSVDILKNGRVRWNISFWNQTDRDLRLAFNYGATTLADPAGSSQGVIDVDTNVAPDDTYEEVVQAGVRVDHWFEFMLPQAGDKKLTLSIAPAQYRSDVIYPQLEVTLP